MATTQGHPGAGALDFFLKIEGIDGETTDSKYKASIAVQSWKWSQAQTGTDDRSATGGAGAGKVQMDDFAFTTKVSKASPKLSLACASGEHFKKAELVCRKAGTSQQVFYTVLMTDVVVSSYETSSGGHNEIIPVENISLNFAKIEWEYKEQKPDGSVGAPVKAGWDRSKNAKI